MTKPMSSRRKFLQSGGSILGASWIAINIPLILSASQKAEENRQAGAAFKNITAREALEFSALVDQIIPADEAPGATEVGVVYFIDAAVGGFMSGALPMLRQGLEDIRSKVTSTHPQVGDLSELSFDQQREVFSSIEGTPFFETLLFLTMCGMFGLPEYGGNRDHDGWKFLGFNHQHAWQPPFGHYDAAVHGAASGIESENE
ncbi:MAG: gluconate 2-dehydrogenase subunit 3 family protein [Gammaproteobacteria bacterium]|nr:gluconate 2-dehydrogenase subunit 3 family protein [Gammaproteobacteria bacterium]NNK97779.1 gluconate 2-dehydrogenase subunit 3 family protein [Xanthomonadales bacterium]